MRRARSPCRIATASFRWYTADPRGVIPLDDGFHVAGTLRALVRQRKFDVRINYDFERHDGDVRPESPRRHVDRPAVDPRLLPPARPGLRPHRRVLRKDQLVGGLYGVSLGGAFFGESMFHRARDASKVALVHLVERLRERGIPSCSTRKPPRPPADLRL
jgi:leucyl/phenylalanyl-tRNA--protein transferase